LQVSPATKNVALYANGAKKRVTITGDANTIGALMAANTN